MVACDRDVEFRVRVEPSDGCEMDVPAENADADREFGCEFLQFVDEHLAFAFVGSGCVVVV